MAAEHEARALLGPESLRPLHARLGALHRRMEGRRLASAQLHGLLAARLDR